MPGQVERAAGCPAIVRAALDPCGASWLRISEGEASPEVPGHRPCPAGSPLGFGQVVSHGQREGGRLAPISA